MANLTLSIDDRLLQAARVRAVKEGTSVNDVCRKAIENYARAESVQDRLERFDALLAAIQAERPSGPTAAAPWQNRAEMYDRILEERHPTLFARTKAAKS